jgi:LEA14-like dessication related protein
MMKKTLLDLAPESAPTRQPLQKEDRRCRLPLPCGLPFFACIVLVLSIGCASMSTIDPLEVTLSNLKITEVTVFETTLVAKLRITNPNPEAFTINGGSFKLTLDEKKVGTGTASETFTVERLDSAVVDAIFHINNTSALLRLQGILQAKEVTYGVQGALFTQGSFGTKKIKIEKTGRLDLSNSDPTEIEGPEINDLNPTG